MILDSIAVFRRPVRGCHLSRRVGASGRRLRPHALAASRARGVRDECRKLRHGCFDGNVMKGEIVMKTIEILGFKAKVARTFWERTRGLIGTKSLAPDEGLLIEKCNAIHMCFMSFPIDAYFLDKDNKVVKTVRNIKPWRLWVWGGWRSVKVLETAVRKEKGCWMSNFGLRYGVVLCVMVWNVMKV